MDYNIKKMASDYGLSQPFVNRLNTTSDYIKNSFNKDREAINTQYNQIINDYENERKMQNQKFTDEGKAAYVDYAKSINPYSATNASNARIGLNNSGFSESSLIGANNTYQNRYTETKNNFENIFADINNRIGKAKENRSVEEAKIAREEQNQLLENFWRINDEYKAEKQRQEELALARANYSSRSSYSPSSNDSSLELNDSSKQQNKNTITRPNKIQGNNVKQIGTVVSAQNGRVIKVPLYHAGGHNFVWNQSTGEYELYS